MFPFGNTKHTEDNIAKSESQFGDRLQGSNNNKGLIITSNQNVEVCVLRDSYTLYRLGT